MVRGLTSLMFAAPAGAAGRLFQDPWVIILYSDANIPVVRRGSSVIQLLIFVASCIIL